MIKDNKIFSIQEYCDKFLTFCPIIKGDYKELEELLYDNGYGDVHIIPFNEIEQIIKNNLDVVLVDTSYINNKCELVNEYSWVEIPDFINATFVSVWDDGYEIETTCKVNLKTKEIKDIDVVEGRDEDGEEVETLIEEYVLINEQKFSAGEYGSGTEYWYE